MADRERERLGDRPDFDAWAAEVVSAVEQRRGRSEPPPRRGLRRLVEKLASVLDRDERRRRRPIRRAFVRAEIR